MGGMRKIQSNWNMIGDTLVHEEAYNWKNERVGISNLKLYGRELTRHNRNKPLDKKKDELILYLCGYIKGYDGTPTGYMLKNEKFIELAVNMLEKYGEKMLSPIRLDKNDIGEILQFLYELEEDDLIGNIPNKQAVMEKWSEEFLRIQQKYNSKIAVFLELYE
mgnify:CR=1 FL=1